MRMKRLKLKKVVITTIACIVLYIIFSSRYHEYQTDILIANTRPEDVWEFVADFSKMRLLNPTILSFKVLADEGNRDHWRYTVAYDEKLSYWPYWKNTATADFSVIKSPLIIESKHETCFFTSLYCLHTKSTFKFSALGSDAYCVENILYECPPFLSSACHRELEYQRKVIMDNLTTIFHKKQD